MAHLTSRTEATWGADPVEQFGGFCNLTVSPSDKFASSLAEGAYVQWSTVESTKTISNDGIAEADLTVDFPSVDWKGLQYAYGWAAFQYQAWIRGEIRVDGDTVQTVVLNIPNVLEYYVGDKHFFGGDVYSFEKAQVVLKLAPGTYPLNIRLVRDVRAMGGVGEPTIELHLKAEISPPQLHVSSQHSVFPDVVNSKFTSPFASISLRNDDDTAQEVTTIHSSSGSVSVASSSLPLLIARGQTRSLPIQLRCDGKCPETLEFLLEARQHQSQAQVQRVHTPSFKLISRKDDEAFKLTYQQSSGTVGYGMLKPPAKSVWEEADSLPVMVFLHGAGLDADNDMLLRSLDDAGDIRAFVLYPTGGSAWSGDDWHQNGYGHVESAVNAVPKWAKDNKWAGPSPSIDRWFLVGHSNGGQGTWHILTHHPDRLIAAAPVSGYSSIQSRFSRMLVELKLTLRPDYVPYHFWHPADPSIRAILDGTLLSYRHELLIENLKGITILNEHGSADDNVPPYHSRLLRQLAVEVGANTTYNEYDGAGHWFEKIMTTKPLVEFYHEQLRQAKASLPYDLPFTAVAARTLDSSFVHGLRIDSLRVPGHLGKVQVKAGRKEGECEVRTHNVASFTIKGWRLRCNAWTIDSVAVTSPADSDALTFVRSNGGWTAKAASDDQLECYSGTPGGLDALLRTKKPLSFWTATDAPFERHIALQLSRNFHQYFDLDGDISNQYAPGKTNVKIMTGGRITIPQVSADSASVGVIQQVTAAAQQMLSAGTTDDGHAQIEVLDHERQQHIFSSKDGPIGGIFLTPSPDPLIPAELVIWGSDHRGLAMAARLAPMLPGVGQPDFVVIGQESLVKGAGGVLAMGFFTSDFSGHTCSWSVSSNAFFA